MKLPVFKHMEPTLLKGLNAGFVLNYNLVDEDLYGIVTKDGDKYLENGYLGCLNAEGKIGAAVVGKPLFVHYTEPLVSLGGDENYAVNLTEGEIVRMVQLFPGDEFITNADIQDDDTDNSDADATPAVANTAG